MKPTPLPATLARACALPQCTKRALIVAAAGAASPDLVATWRSRCDNTLVHDLRAEPEDRKPWLSREVEGAHYTRVRPSVEGPNRILVVYSPAVASMLGLDPPDEMCQSSDFLELFSGQLPEDADSWATCYGASFNGNYGGQRGDGRAISIGQLRGFEVQLKGAGVTPYSRRFDGRAVLRSSVREFLASEAMAALGVPTTRSLCVVETGETVLRAWYDDSGAETAVREPGAVGTRVATSFLRFGQFEIFHERGEIELLRELAEHAIDREFGHLRVQSPGAPLSSLIVSMFAEIAERQAHLVAEWLRVGYCQGNMNSDNSAIGGVTLDYGPFAFMERFQPLYNPWVGGGMGYSFGRQPQAAAINLVRLCEALCGLVDHVGSTEGMNAKERMGALEELRRCVSHRYADAFNSKHEDDCRSKLGLASWDDEAANLWSELFKLMSYQSAEVDFTCLFRALGEVDGGGSASVTADREGGDSGAGALGSAPEDAVADKCALLDAVRASALDDIDGWPDAHRSSWLEWLRRYDARVSAERSAGFLPDQRRQLMSKANPKYILRNHMAAEA